MAGKRLLDAALVINATRKVAKQHLNIQFGRLDTWSKTSSVAKAAKNQTDRVTLTVQAANALAKRFNDNAPNYSDLADSEKRGFETQSTSQQETTNQTSKSSIEKLSESKSNSSEFKTTKKIEPSTSNPNQPSTAEQGQNEIPQKATIPEQENIPDGINTDVFHSPRVAKILGGRVVDSALRLKGGQSTPVDKTKLSQGLDQDTIYVRESDQVRPSDLISHEKDKESVKAGQHEDSALESKTQPSNQRSNGTAKVVSDNSTDVAPEVANLAANLSKDTDKIESESDRKNEAATHPLRESRVPSSRLGRLWQYGGLATSMAFGAVGEGFRRVTGGAESGGSILLGAGNMERLVAKLSKMRGAALKLGQMMSFQDSKMLPDAIAQVLQRVQDNADYMPASQRDKVLSSNLGSEWRSLFASFDEVPFAAASIGQVHKGVLAADGTPVAIKIQYPGVAQSISSDLNNLSILLTASRLLPKGLFLDKTIANARTELAWECDYKREAECQTRFSSLLAASVSPGRMDEDVFLVPKVIESACGPQVLTAEMMEGTAVAKASLNLSQAERDWIGTHLLRLCLMELTQFKFMQTDPNWTNFLYNQSTKKLELLDFGAAREFPDKFVDPYVRNLAAAARNDRREIADLSITLGYLTGNESKTMREAHVDSVLTLAEPFMASQINEIYDFHNQTITDRVRALIPVMVRERLAPPPEETYSLHRKLSGAFLLLARLGSRVQCRKLFVDALQKWDPSVKLE